MNREPAKVVVAVRSRGRWPAIRTLLHVYLHLIGFAGSTLLLTWGLFVFAFLALGGFSFDGLMHQLDNLTSRYLAASSDRIASFRTMFVAAHLLVAFVLVVLRHEKILPAALSKGTPDHA